MKLDLRDNPDNVEMWDHPDLQDLEDRGENLVNQDHRVGDDSQVLVILSVAKFH